MRFLSTFVSAGTLGAVLLAGSAARATSLDACGNIDVSANASCKVMTQGGCTAQCTPVNVDIACNGKLEVSCQGGCTAMVDASCTTQCSGTCSGQCNADPGKFDCGAQCKTQCSGDCDARCASNGNVTQCKASCNANCSSECDAQCSGTPPSATCQAKCQGCCSGTCTAKVTADCQISCQAKGMVQCEADVSGGCKAQCTKPEGAIFCDGHYVDVGNNFQKCMDALNAVLNVKVDASASCSGNTCTGKAGISCGSVAPGEPAIGGTGLLVGLGAAAAAFARRRRRTK